MILSLEHIISVKLMQNTTNLKLTLLFPEKLCHGLWDTLYHTITDKFPLWYEFMQRRRFKQGGYYVRKSFYFY